MPSEARVPSSRSHPTTDELRTFIAQGWEPRDVVRSGPSEAARHAVARRERASACFPGDRLVIPAGGLKVRSNDCDYAFRPHSAFAHLTGLGSDREPDAVLVLEPSADGTHEAVLFVRPMAGRDRDEFFADARYGEFWVGARPSPEELESELGIPTRHLDELADAVVKDCGAVTVRMVRDADWELTRDLDQRRCSTTTDETLLADRDDELAHALSTMRLVKDEWEVGQLRLAVDATLEGFEQVIARLPEAVAQGRGERFVEGVFGLVARHRGNGAGYDSICAAGNHATTLHWVRNTGDIRDGELLLLDAGVEVDSLFTADVTRTLPVSGKFTATQREIYDAVHAASEAAIAVIRPGALFSDIHAAAIRVIAHHLESWGLLPDGVDVEATLDVDHGQYHRRWMVHGTSHHLGLDVHDCQRATREEYFDAELTSGMVLTVEPGLYFKADDLLVPEAFRGIGVRIEDDILVTADGCENLSAGFPRSADDVEAWVHDIQTR
jgi:Xaa-Pro aminopeptidase